MKKIIIGMTVLASISSFAADCTVSVIGLKTSTKKVSAILEPKGYTVTYLGPKYVIHSANYLGSSGVETKIVNMFERGHVNRIAFTEKDVSFFKGFKEIEKNFLESLPECK